MTTTPSGNLAPSSGAAAPAGPSVLVDGPQAQQQEGGSSKGLPQQQHQQVQQPPQQQQQHEEQEEGKHTQEASPPPQQQQQEPQPPPVDLVGLLGEAFPGGPRSVVPGGDPAAAVVLGLHVAMVAAGFRPDHSGSGGGAAAPAAVNASSLAWAPPAAWASAGADQWLLSYTRPGCANGFSLFCSLQRPSGRMLVNGLEASNLPANSHYLGLLVQKYVPNPGALLTTTSWSNVLTATPDLVNQLQLYIIEPLLARCMPLLGSTVDSGAVGGAAGGDESAHALSWLRPGPGAGGGGRNDYVWGAVALTAVVVGGMLVYMSLSSRQRRVGGGGRGGWGWGNSWQRQVLEGRRR